MLINADLSGADWQNVAYLSRDPEMMRVAKSGKSPHLMTGMRMSGLSEDIIMAEHKRIGEMRDPELIAEIRRTEFPEILTSKFLPRTMTIRQAAKKCLVGETEVLTRQGWKRIDAVIVGEEIIQWDEGELSFAPILKTWAYKNDEPLLSFESNHLAQVVTKEHRFPLIKNGKSFLSCIASAMPSSTSFSVPVNGTLKQEASLFSEFEIRLLVAVQADGSVNPYGQVVFRLHKERKLERLEWLLKALGLDVAVAGGKTIHIPRCDVTNKIVKYLCSFEYKRQKRHKEKTLRRGNLRKLFGSYLLQLGEEERIAFMEEVTLWDGYNERSQYFSGIEENALWVQTIAHLTNMRATVRSVTSEYGFSRNPMYWVKLGKANNTNTTGFVRTLKHGVSKVYCVSVPSSFFMVRYKGKISISGNSNHGLNYREGHKVFALTNEMEESEAKKITEAYTCQSWDHGKPLHECGPVAYPGIRDWWDRIDAEVARTRTLTNCFGRRVYFMGALDRDTFKQAYAFLPQSTVFDVTRQAMIKFMDDDSPLFSHAQLLAQVHDSLLSQYLKLDFPAMAAFTIKLGLDYMSPTLDYGEPFVLGTDVKVGLNWENMIGLKLTPDIDDLARQLKNAWDKLKSERSTFVIVPAASSIVPSVAA